MNIVLVVFDTLRKDCLGAYGAPFWGKTHTPHLDAFAQESVTFTRAYPEALPTLPARRGLYTGQRVYPFAIGGDVRLKGDFVGAFGWGPIREDRDTVAELLHAHGYRTGLISDLYHQFKPSKNFWRGFDQWTFLRGQELDPARSGPEPSQEQIDFWLAPEIQHIKKGGVDFVKTCIRNMYGRDREEDYFNARVMIEATRWLEQNQDAERFFLVVESFDPHEPWFVPAHYRQMYDPADGQEQVISFYRELDDVPPHLTRRAQANFSGLVTMCDRWFGHLYEKLRVLGRLDDTLIIVVSDHGHAIGDDNYMGKRGYPSRPEVFDLALFVRHPAGTGAGTRSDRLVQHTDIAAQILAFAGVEAKQPLHGQPFWEAALTGGPALRDHVTVGWSSAMTVIDDRWWMNCKVDGTGVFLHDLRADQPFARNVADDHPDEVRRLYALGVQDAGGEFPPYVLDAAAQALDAPGCSALAARAVE